VSEPDSPQEKDKPAGRVRHDSTGRAIWEWAAESGRHAVDSTSRLLKRLDLPGLTLDDEEKKKQEKEAEDKAAAALKVAAGKRSFNPYDNRTPVKKVAAAPGQKPVPRVTQPEIKRGFFARLFGGR
jgi:hypothetical protein